MLPAAMKDVSRCKPRPAAPAKPVTLTINSTCDATGLSRTTIYGLINQGRLKTIAIGRRRLVVYSSIEALMEAAV
jgi:excisionase family DNA binding protein